MPSTDRKLELKAKTSVAQTASQPCVGVKGLTGNSSWLPCAAQGVLGPDDDDSVLALIIITNTGKRKCQSIATMNVL
jgi:hypothetical protein